MTKEEFLDQSWCSGMEAIYQDNLYAVATVNYKSLLVGLVRSEDGDEITWARCEDVQLTPETVQMVAEVKKKIAEKGKSEQKSTCVHADYMWAFCTQCGWNVDKEQGIVPN